MVKYGFIHIMPIGVDVGHVFTVLDDPKFKPIQKIYLLHSPDDKKFTYEKTAKKLKKDIEKAHPRISVKLVQIDAFSMGSIRNKIKRIVIAEYENVNSIKNIAVNVTGGTNLMAVASLWAAGINKISAYYVLDNRYQNLPEYLLEIDTPMLKNQLEEKPKLQKMLYILNEQTFHWPGIIEDDKKYKLNINISDSIWLSEQKIKGVSTLNDFKKIMEEHGVPKTTTRNRLIKMANDGFVRMERNVPKRSIRGKGRYEHYEYFIDQKEELISITDTGKDELIGYTP